MRKDPQTISLQDNGKQTLRISSDCFSILPRQLQLQINKYVLNAITRVFKINMLSLLIAEICHGI